MSRRILAILALIGWLGCDSGRPSFRVGDEVTFTNSATSQGKGWLPIDEAAFAEMGKPPAEFDQVFDQLVADHRLFEERYTARAVVEATKFLGTKAAKVRIKEGDHPGREAWLPVSRLFPAPKR